jgi:hypothetical protein
MPRQMRRRRQGDVSESRLYFASLSL